ncbi:MAG: CYTH domain-containing protein [Gammaproteobacteria bacterium]|jgi:inorganic triphosphatase YgiF|nr:CYTH domain-containing protein [Gammaproteobacteria bacterium]MBT3489196.1 CYTH domain-containing protein [Gammaproteobacteria bacterium]MBT3718085.1 CYTH domain-containing protein [Gammaproteobacteria bacterium]MBT3845120.1 CYTH domain-containing protein [Gammaproteobacteria bacterium]MBT3893486.1 CYTH domain-containing protein [Gammaproteobacteria bacterium]
METELKLALSSEQIVAVEALPLLQKYGDGVAEERRLISTYYDTPALELRAERISLRLRDKGDGWVRTVKTAGSSEGGLHRRNEYEVKLTHAELDLEVLSELGIVVLNRAIDEQQLQPQFVTDFVRKQWLLHTPQGEVEFALDLGGVRACDAGQDGAEIKICEIELELRDTAEDADPTFLFQISDEIRAAGIMVELDAVSKAERGYSLISG